MTDPWGLFVVDPVNDNMSWRNQLFGGGTPTADYYGTFDRASDVLAQRPLQAFEGGIAAVSGFTFIPLPYAENEFTDYMHCSGEVVGMINAGGKLICEGAEKTFPVALKESRARLVAKFGKLPEGSRGATDKYGNITITSGLTGQGFRETLRHELVHSFFTPGEGMFQELRANIAEWGYWNSHLLRYLGEAIAEGYATQDILRGLRHPFVEAYRLSLWRIAGEASGASALAIGGGYSSYQYGSNR